MFVMLITPSYSQDLQVLLPRLLISKLHKEPLWIFTMNRYSPVFLFLIAVPLLFIIGCDSKTTKQPTVINQGQDDPVSPPENPNDSLKDMGKLEAYTDSNNPKSHLLGQSIISAYSVLNKSNESLLTTLKICSHTSCWTLFDDESLIENKEEVISESKAVLKKGSYIMRQLDVSIESLHYIYNKKKGVINLGKKITFGESMFQRIYLSESKALGLVLSSISIPRGVNKLYIPDEGIERYFPGGLLLSQDKGALDKPALINTDELTSGSTQITKLPIKSYQVRFFSIGNSKEQAKEMLNIVPKAFDKPLSVYLPVVQPGDIDQTKFVLVIDGRIKKYSIVKKNDNRYALFKTNKTNFNALIVKHHPSLGWE